jgi:type I restriction enzyme R subunit
MKKNAFSERSICTNFVAPAIETFGGDKATQFLGKINPTSGRLVVRAPGESPRARLQIRLN